MVARSRGPAPGWDTRGVMRRRLPAAAATAWLAVGTLACAADPSTGPPPSPSPAPSVASPTSPTPARETTGLSPAPSPVTLVVVGDIMLGRGVAAAHPDPVATLQALRPLLRRADVTVGNLESTLSTVGPPTQGDDSFSAPPKVLDGLAGAGFDALSLANNHTGDHGPAALVATAAAFRGSGIRAFGAGRDLRAAARPAIIRARGTRVGFLGFNAIGETPEAGARTPGALSVSMPPRTGPLDLAELRRVLAAVRHLARRVDTVVVLPHWGAQYTHVAEPVQSLVGRRLVDAGADLVVGGHPHWVQGTERYRGAVIAHSLGNAVFDMDFMEQTMEGVVLTATLVEGEVAGVRLTPYRMDAAFVPRPLTGTDAAAVLDDVRRHSRGGLPSAGRQPGQQQSTGPP